MVHGSGNSWVEKGATAFLLAALAVLVAAVIPLCLVPPVAKDVIIHHLSVPKLYLEHGGIYEIPGMVFSYYPMNLNLLYMIPLAFGHDILPALIHFAFALGTAWMLFSFMAHRFGRPWGLAGALFFLSTPIIVKLSSTAYIDLGVLFFSTASLLLLVKWLEDGFPTRTLLASGALCGLAMGTKYNGLVSFFLLFCAVVFLRARYRKRGGSGGTAVYAGAVFALAAVVLYAPWAVKNYIWTGNPIYPLFNGLFNPGMDRGSSIGIFSYRELFYGETWWQIAALPVRIFFEGADGDPARFDGVLNPLLFLLPWLSLLPCRNGPPGTFRHAWIFATFSVLFFFFAMFSTSMRTRYISPIIPPLVMLSVYGLYRLKTWFEETRPGLPPYVGRGAVGALMGIALWVNGAYLVDLYRYVTPFEYLTGEISRDDYISRYRGEYAAFRFINQHLPEDALVLFVFIGNRGYYCDRDYLYDMQGMRSTIEDLVNTEADSAGVRDGLRERGVTHLLIGVEVFERWATEKFSKEKLGVVQDFFNRCTSLMHLENGYGVFALSPKIEGPGSLK
jgi:hypothetical protein